MVRSKGNLRSIIQPANGNGGLDMDMASEGDHRGEYSNFRETLVRHDGLIKGLGDKMAGLETKIDAQGAVLGKIETFMATSNAKPHLSVGHALSMMVNIAVLFSLVVGGIIYVAHANSGVAEWRLSKLENTMDHVFPAPTMASTWVADLTPRATR